MLGAALTMALLSASGSVRAIFSLTVPAKRSGSWGTMPICLRSESNSTFVRIPLYETFLIPFDSIYSTSLFSILVSVVARK